jgi:gas vesicle protein
MNQDLIDNILTQKRFSTAVEKFIKKTNSSVMESIIHVCEENNIDPSETARLLSPSLKSKLEAEAMFLNLIPKGNSLPV